MKIIVELLRWHQLYLNHSNPQTLQDPLCLAHTGRMMHYVDILEVNDLRDRLSVLFSSEMQTYSFS